MSGAPRTEALLNAADEIVQIGVRGMAGVALQLVGTFTATVTFQATVDGETWVSFNMVPSNSATAVSTGTAAGAWSANCAGYESVRANVTAYTSGRITATLQAGEGAGRY